MSILDLARPELRELAPYDSASAPADFLRLNANEAPAAPCSTPPGVEINRYPQMRPAIIQNALAGLYDVAAESLCPVRGSSEGIDLLIRSFCRAYTDNVIVLPPNFEMYGAYAKMHGAEVRQVPLNADNFAVDWTALEAACDANSKIVFLCSPNNPTGNHIPIDEIIRFTRNCAGRSLVVIDEAYVEFSAEDSLIRYGNEHPNLVVLRTLSKAYALAGARCGAVIAHPDIVKLVAAMASPYALSTPATDFIIDALTPDCIARANVQIAAIISERQRLCAALESCDAIETVWPSAANFLLVRIRRPELVENMLAENRILIRQFKDTPALDRCARITVGSALENDRLLSVIHSCGSTTR